METRPPKLPSSAELDELMRNKYIPQSSRKLISSTHRHATLAINPDQKNLLTQVCLDAIEASSIFKQVRDESEYHLGVAAFKDCLAQNNQNYNEVLSFFLKAVEGGVLAAHYWIVKIYIEMMNAVENEKKKALFKNMIHNNLLIIASNIEDQNILALLRPTEKINLYEILEKYKLEAKEKVSSYYQAAEYIRSDILHSSKPEENSTEMPHANQSHFYLKGIDYTQKYLASGDSECMKNAIAGLEVANDTGTIDAVYWMIKIYRHILTVGSEKEKAASIRKIKMLLNQFTKNIKIGDKLANLSEEEIFSFIKIIKNEYDHNDKKDENYLSALKYCLNHLTYTCVDQNPMSAEANYLRGQCLALCTVPLISVLDYYCAALMLGSQQALDAMIEVLKLAKRLNKNEKKVLNHLLIIKDLFSHHHYVDLPFTQQWRFLIELLQKTYGTVKNEDKQTIFDKNKFKLQLAFYLVKQPYRLNSYSYDLDAIFTSVELTNGIDVNQYLDIFAAISSEMTLAKESNSTNSYVTETQSMEEKPKTKKIRRATMAPLKRAKHANNENPLPARLSEQYESELAALAELPSRVKAAQAEVGQAILQAETVELRADVQVEPALVLAEGVELQQAEIVGKIDLPENIHAILSELSDGYLGYLGYLVGSQVKRRLRDESGPRLDKIDCDLVTSAPLPDADTVIIAGEKFIRSPTNHRLFKHEKLKIEIFYSEELAISLEEDAYARDFTTTFYANKDGFVVTPIKGALADLHAGIIRTIKPWYESFSKYPIHILRYIKFLNEGDIGLYSPHKIQQVLHFLEDKNKINDEQIFYYLARILMDGKAVSGLDKLVEFGVYQKILGCIDPDLIADLRKTLAKTDRQFAEHHSLSWPRVFSLFVMAHIIDDLHQEIISYQSFLNPGPDKQYQAAQDYIEAAMLSMRYPPNLIDAIMGRDKDDSKNINTQYIKRIIDAVKNDKAYQQHQARKQSNYSPSLFQSVSLRDENDEDEVIYQHINTITQ